MQCPKVAIFDFDDTLSESFQAPKPDMLERLGKLIEIIPVALMTGAGFSRIQNQVIAGMPHMSGNFSIFPNSASQCYLYKDNRWQVEYDNALTPEERDHIKQVILESAQEVDVIRDTPHFGEQIADREAQIAFTVVGLDAPQDIKIAWDPDGAKRRAMIKVLKTKIPEYDILTGGASTIDVTRGGINKAYGVEWFSKHLNIPAQEMLYIGDALYPGGNDAVVIPTGIQTIMVSGPEETAKIIDELLMVCAI